MRKIYIYIYIYNGCKDMSGFYFILFFTKTGFNCNHYLSLCIFSLDKIPYRFSLDLNNLTAQLRNLRRMIASDNDRNYLFLQELLISHPEYVYENGIHSMTPLSPDYTHAHPFELPAASESARLAERCSV